jgi:hypothetical protein
MPENTTEFDPKYDNYDFPTTAPVAQSGHAGHTTPEQNAQVFQLRSMLEQAGCKERLDTLRLVRHPSAHPTYWWDLANTMAVAFLTCTQVQCRTVEEDVRTSSTLCYLQLTRLG